MNKFKNKNKFKILKMMKISLESLLFIFKKETISTIIIIMKIKIFIVFLLKKYNKILKK